jgi:hypothetical protein
MSAELEKQHTALPGLLADRAAKEGLTKQLAAANEELARTTLANQRLQGLCRALQVGIGGGGGACLCVCERGVGDANGVKA